ncbi:MAG: MCE family protein [Betaproteobacteria bacterium]|nr:MCE family protein [Betaproteobacteria bacterium]
MSEVVAEEIPRARLRRRSRWLHAMWILPVLAAAVAGYLIWDRMRTFGPEITIEFRDGGGLRAGQTPIKYRGVQIGEVTRVDLSADHSTVLVRARLQRTAASLAREGAVFWIVRPQVGWGQVTGLNTVISGPEIQVLDGKGGPARRFAGLEKAPVGMGEPGLKIVLKAERPVSLRANSPVYYRGVEVGLVQELDLSADSRAADIHILVYQRYARLVRTGSAFWNVSGVSLKAGLLKGVELDIESLRALVAGGIEFASPERSPQARAGTVFFLHENPKTEWLAWSAKIPIPPESASTGR